METLKITPEKKFEQEPDHNLVIVDFIRHGETNYTNQGLDLTSAGNKQVAESAQNIAGTIDKENDIVIVWDSPAVRAQGSSRILKQILKEREIETHSSSQIRLMRNCDLKDREFVEEVVNSMSLDEIQKDFARGRLGNDDQIESYESVKKRAERVFRGISTLAKNAQLQGKRLRIVGVSHFEFLNPIMEDIFGYRVEDKEEVKFAENLRIAFDFDKSSGELTLSADFRGEHKDNIFFDEKTGKFTARL